MKPVRIYYFSTWLNGIADAEEYLAAQPKRDLSEFVENAANAEIMRMARLDSDWDAENLRCFHWLSGNDFREFRREESSQLPKFLPAKILNLKGLMERIQQGPKGEEESWLLFIAQRPGAYGEIMGKVLKFFTMIGGKILFWSYDQASTAMPGYSEHVAPWISALIHDEAPLVPNVQKALPEQCLKIHKSWVANIVPFSCPFNLQTKPKISMLCSKLGFTDHRRKQAEYLQQELGEQFQETHNHSVPVSERFTFSELQAHLCPEGRKFTTAEMSDTHTDRPFWSGCMGQVPIVENSQKGTRLQRLAERELILRYDWNDLSSLLQACRRALKIGSEQRREMYIHFNRFETVGPVAARTIQTFYGAPR